MTLIVQDRGQSCRHFQSTCMIIGVMPLTVENSLINRNHRFDSTFMNVIKCST